MPRHLGALLGLSISLVAGVAGWHAIGEVGRSAPAAAIPQSVLLTAFNPRGATLAQTVRDRAGLRRLQRDLEQLLPRSVVEAPCPADDGSHYRAVFSYAHRKAIVAEVRRTGCETVTLPGRWAPTITWANPQLLSDLDALFPPEWQRGF